MSIHTSGVNGNRGLVNLLIDEDFRNPVNKILLDSKEIDTLNRCVNGYSKKEGLSEKLKGLAYRIFDSIKYIFGCSEKQKVYTMLTNKIEIISPNLSKEEARSYAKDAFYKMIEMNNNIESYIKYVESDNLEKIKESNRTEKEINNFNYVDNKIIDNNESPKRGRLTDQYIKTLEAESKVIEELTKAPLLFPIFGIPFLGLFGITAALAPVAIPAAACIDTINSINDPTVDQPTNDC